MRVVIHGRTKVSKSLFTLLMGLTTASAALISSLIAVYIPTATGVAISTFVGAVSGLVVTYFATERENAPGVRP